MNKIYASKCSDMSEREKRNMDKVRLLASQGMVLLENDGILPIMERNKILALYGTGARKTVKGGSGSGDVNSRYTVSVEKGLENAGFRIGTKAWLDEYDRLERNAYLEWGKKGAEDISNGVSPLVYLMEKAFQAPSPQSITERDVIESDTDTAIYVLSRKSGEGTDRHNCPGDYQLAREEEDNLKFLVSHYEKVVVVLNIGGVIDTRFLRETEGIGAVLLMSQAGCAGGDALADIISGKVNPSGKLTDTWAEKYEDYPFSGEFSHNDGNLDDSYYKEGIYVGYRYFDTFNVAPAYCFGYGLSYTTFEIHTKEIALEKEDIVIKVTVFNAGKRSGKEVVQIYCSAPGAAGRGKGKDLDIQDKPYQELVAFAKTKLLAPGETQTVDIRFSVRNLASYQEKEAAWILDAGMYYFRVGNSSRDTRISGGMIVNHKIVTEQLENLFPLDCELEELSGNEGCPISYEGEEAQKKEAEENACVLDEESIIRRKTKYFERNPALTKMKEKITLEEVKRGTAKLEDLVACMTIEEMTDLCVGREEEGFSVIGNAGITVPGAAGETTDKLKNKYGIPSLVLADGPAGLRLTSKFEINVEGKISNTGGFDALSLVENIDKEQVPCESEKKQNTIYYQYCTAIPVATLLAQSWDMDLIEECGSIVGEEMQEFGVNLWLAPGMNIHRNPLCGRNFEYYSEDPLLSGKCAAADTRGVQIYWGRGTTIKHFATNNQEDNRSFENNHVGERALREIYLKGFEICIKEAQPIAIMTSYNLLNGIHTANRRDLLTSVARDEWGFEGIVMTDWGTTGDMELFNGQPKYPSSSAASCIFAGNDLIMPGSAKDKEEIIKSVKEGVLSLNDLQACALHILKQCMYLYKQRMT